MAYVAGDKKKENPPEYGYTEDARTDEDGEVWIKIERE
jgi:hypothetical protein